MKVQRVRLPSSDQYTWTVLDRGYLPVEPIEAFLHYLRNIERSPNTIRSYAYHLKAYWQFLDETQLDWKTVGLSEIANFVAWLRNPLGSVTSINPQQAKRTEATINTIITALCMFYDYHEREHEVEHVPLYRTQVQPNRRYKSFLHHINRSKPTRSRLIKLKEPRRIPKTVSKVQIQQLIKACCRTRDKFLVCLLYESGMRIGQALGLRHEDIQSWDNRIEIVPRHNSNGARAKTREQYTIDVSMDLMGLYTDYLLNEFGEIDSDYVFVNLWDGEIGRPMRYGAAVDLFVRLSEKTGIYIRPHMLRHTHATELFCEGKWDAALVQKRLGHAQIQTTINTYLHLTDDDLKQAYQDYIGKRKQLDGTCSNSVDEDKTSEPC